MRGPKFIRQGVLICNQTIELRVLASVKRTAQDDARIGMSADLSRTQVKGR